MMLYKFGPLKVTKTRTYEIDAFHDHLNKQNPVYKEIQESGKLHFLDCLVSRDNNDCERQCTENRRIPTDYVTNHPTTRLHTKPRL